MSAARVRLPMDVEIRKVGNERTPVILIDNLLEDTRELIDAACRQDFQHTAEWGYPGVRCSLPDTYRETVLDKLIPLIRETYSVPESCSFKTIHSLFSLVAQPPETLSLLQRMPHYDTTREFYFASVHYLNPGTHGGTGIFRHKPTGYERLSPERYPLFVAAAKKHVAAHGEPPPAYINGSTDHFELVEAFEYRPNRMVIYPGNILHSGMIEPARDISMDPVSGRLTANLFIDFDTARAMRRP